MAIERTAQNIDFGSAPQAGAVPTSVQFASPDVNKFADNDRAAPVQNSTLDNLVAAIAPGVNKLAQKEVSNATQEAYLRGAQAAATGAAAESVDSNVFTKDWATAGYADVKGRLAQADAEADTTANMQKLREMSPQDFSNYLAQRREKILNNTEGMSLEARKGMLAQQITSDRAAVARQMVEHQKFIIDQIGTSVSTDMSVRIDGMNQAKGDPISYQGAVENAYAGVYNNIWSNPNLPKDQRVKLTTEAATLALSSNNETLYERMRDSKLPGAQGSMLDQLPFDDQVKLAQSYKQSRQDTANIRLGDFATQRGLMEANFADKNSPPMAWSDVKAFMDKGDQLQALKADDKTAITKAWAESNSKKMDQAAAAQAYITGDVNKQFSLGKTEQEGLDAAMHVWQRSGYTPAQTAAALLQIGSTTGQASAYKQVGELSKSAVYSIGQGGTIDPGQLSMLNTIVTSLDQVQGAGKSTALSGYLSSFDEQGRAKIMAFREGIQAGKDPLVAAADAADMLNKTSQLDPAQRNVLAANHAKADLAAVQQIDPRGLWGTIKNTLVPDALRSQDGVNIDKLNTGRTWFTSEDRAQRQVAQSKAAVLDELNYISRDNPYASDATRVSLALAKVADRTLKLDDGPLVLPRMTGGATVQSFFGVRNNVSPDTIAATLNDLHKAGSGNQVIWSVNGNAQLQWAEYNNKDQLVSPGGTLDPKSISQAVQDRQDKQTDKFAQTYGPGITVQGISFNGNNTGGIPNEDMLALRQSLVNHEGVKDVPYDDLSGKVVNGKRVQTVGVGVSSHNPAYPQVGEDGKVTKADIESSFMRASNNAAIAGQDLQTRLNLPGSAAFKLLSELAYQGGAGFTGVKANQPYAAALRSRDLDAALSALKDTVPYKMSQGDRRSYYEELTRQALAQNRS